MYHDGSGAICVKCEGLLSYQEAGIYLHYVDRYQLL